MVSSTFVLPNIMSDPRRIPSIAWQFFWAWIYAPYLLWKVRKIHDLHGWRLQTIVCCVAGLVDAVLKSTLSSG